MKALLLLPVLFVLFVPTAFAEEESQDCIFTAYIEKSWVKFSEKPWVTGFVNNCDPENIEHNYISNIMKDMVYVRILDINGDLVNYRENPDNIITGLNKDEGNSNSFSFLPQKFNAISKFVFNDSVYRKGSFTGNADVSEVEVIHLRPNQYFFYMPLINELEFEHRGIYQVELTYINEVRTIYFAVLDPDIWYEDNIVEIDICDGDFANKIISLSSTLRALEGELELFKLKGQIEKYNTWEEVMQDKIDEISSYEECYTYTK